MQCFNAHDQLGPGAAPYELRRAASPGRPPCLELDCRDDEQAILQAWRHATLQPVEVWQGRRLVCRLEPSQPVEVCCISTIYGNPRETEQQPRVQARTIKKQLFDGRGALHVDESNFPVSVYSSTLSSLRIPLVHAPNSFGTAGSNGKIGAEEQLSVANICTRGGSAV